MFVVFGQGSRIACYSEDPEVTCSTDRLELHPTLSSPLRPTVNVMHYPGALQGHHVLLSRQLKLLCWRPKPVVENDNENKNVHHLTSYFHHQRKQLPVKTKQNKKKVSFLIIGKTNLKRNWLELWRIRHHSDLFQINWTSTCPLLFPYREIIIDTVLSLNEK